MAGYTKNRETNYEIKYLRKVMGQVDKRIQVPESVSADSLRHLLDSVEAPSVRETVTRRPFRLSLQSGIAYAAAFALIVALFYSTKLYRPDIISGGLDISAAEQQPAEAVVPYAAAVDADVETAGDGEAPQAFAIAETTDTPLAEPISLDNTIPVETQDGAEASRPLPAVGGSGHATLVLEQDGYAFYWRENDLSDPDRMSPISFETVNTVTQESVAQTDVPLLRVIRSFELDGNILLVGYDLEGGTAICSYDVSAADGTFVEDIFTQDGELVDADMYEGIVRVVSHTNTGESEQDSELLPNSVSGEICLITTFNPKTQETVTKRFVGAIGAVQLDNQIATIVYPGQDENGESSEYIAQINFNGMEITLGTIS